MAATWRVVPPQREFDDISASGGFIPTIEVTFEIIASGTQGTVRVTERDYTVERVTQLIDEKAATMAAVDGLG